MTATATETTTCNKCDVDTGGISPCPVCTLFRIDGALRSLKERPDADMREVVERERALAMVAVSWAPLSRVPYDFPQTKTARAQFELNCSNAGFEPDEAIRIITSVYRPDPVHYPHGWGTFVPVTAAAAAHLDEVAAFIRSERPILIVRDGKLVIESTVTRKRHRVMSLFPLGDTEGVDSRGDFGGQADIMPTYGLDHEAAAAAKARIQRAAMVLKRTTNTTRETRGAVVVTRHAALVEFLKKNNFKVDGVASPHVDEGQIAGKPVIGVLPLHLAAKAASVTEVKLNLTPEQRGRELSLVEVEAAECGIKTYLVVEVADSFIFREGVPLV